MYVRMTIKIKNIFAAAAILIFDVVLVTVDVIVEKIILMYFHIVPGHFQT